MASTQMIAQQRKAGSLKRCVIVSYTDFYYHHHFFLLILDYPFSRFGFVLILEKSYIFFLFFPVLINIVGIHRRGGGGGCRSEQAEESGGGEEEPPRTRRYWESCLCQWCCTQSDSSDFSTHYEVSILQNYCIIHSQKHQ